MPYSEAQKKQYFAIKAALTPAEKALINYYELQWHFRKHVPTVYEVTEYLRKKMPRIRQTSVNYYLTRQPVIKALKARGIPYEQHSQKELTDQQIAAALTVMNFADTRTTNDKLDSLGISSAQYFAWLKDPIFQSHVQALADQNLENIDPVAKTEFAKKIHEGDWKAVEFYLKTVGTLNQSSAPQSEVMLKAFIEIVQKYIKDPEIMLAIANDLIKVSANRTLSAEAAVNQPALEGDFSETDALTDPNEEEVLEAARKLGL